MPPDDQDSLLKQLEKIRRKADQQATAHAWLRDRYQLVHSILSTVSLVTGVFLLAIVMATPDLIQRTIGIPSDWYQWFVAIFAAGSFSIVAVQLAWRLDAKATLHDQAVRHYTKVAYQASNSAKEPNGIAKDEVDEILEEYLDVRDLPRIPESKFLKLKQWHLRKVRMSKELDKNPYESLRDMRQRLDAESRNRGSE